MILIFRDKIKVKFIEYTRKCNRGDWARRKTFKFAIEVFDPITGECMLENQKEFNDIFVRFKKKSTVDLTKVCNRGMMNPFYQETMNKMMEIKNRDRCI